MSKRKHKLIIVAHPDDETLFFAGLLLSARRHPWKIICVTDGNADGGGKQRATQLALAAKTLGAEELLYFNLPDHFDLRLDQSLLRKKLAALEMPVEVYTHGPIGEYGHPHHQDVCFGVHKFYHNKCPVFAPAHNCLADKIIRLSDEEFKIKTKLLAKIYFSETQRFINFVPATSVETFAKFDFDEIKNIYLYLTNSKKLNPKKLEKYRWFLPYFSSFADKTKARPF